MTGNFEVSGIEEFWMTPKKWPKSRLDDYVFLLDALNRIGRAAYKDLWDEQRGYFARRHPVGPRLPGSPAEATDDMKEIVNDLLLVIDENYFPNPQRKVVWNPDVQEFDPVGEDELLFSDLEWSTAKKILNGGLSQSDPHYAHFEQIVDIIATAAATGKLRTYLRPQDRGEFRPIAATRWDLELNQILHRFAFGRDNSEIPRNWIFVSAYDLMDIIDGKPKQAAKVTISVKNKCINWLVRLRLAEEKKGAREDYHAAFKKIYPEIEFDIFIKWWNESRDVAAREYEKRLAAWGETKAGPKPTAFDWGKKGRPEKGKRAPVIEYGEK